MNVGLGQFSTLSAIAAAALGTYSTMHEVTQVFDLVTGLLGLAAIGAAVLWWRSRA